MSTIDFRFGPKLLTLDTGVIRVHNVCRLALTVPGYMYRSYKISEVLAGFQDYMRDERNFSPKTIHGYKEALRLFIKISGDLNLETIRLQHFVTFKTRMADRNAGQSWVRNIIHASKTLLTYSRDVLEIPVMDIARIKAPRVLRKPVLYVSPEDLEKFLAAIPLETSWGRPRQAGYCLRALVEMLLATGMRISEVLRLDRDDVNFEKREAKVLGKRNKPRLVFFTERSLEWLAKYLALRKDSNTALLVSTKHTRLTADSVGATFRRTKQWAGITSPITPHILRHTTATTLLRNGCPIGYIKELLGHQDLQTTCRYYLGVLDHSDVKKAHDKYSSGTEPPA